MSTFAKTYTGSVPRTGWPPGRWDDEPDKAQWVDPATDLDCLIVRNHQGALCGYVGLPNTHPLYGSGYSYDWDDDTETPGRIVGNLDVHGGITYTATCDEGDDPSRGICHVPEAGRPHDIWWLGFDTAHHMDLVPSMLRFGPRYHDGTYRTISYVVSECESLARQLVSA
jgi:hypothetical protein